MADGFFQGLKASARPVGEGLLAFTTGTPLPQVKQQLGEERLGLQSSRDQTRMASLASGAAQLKNIQDPQRKLEFLTNRKAELQRAGIGTEDTDEAIQLINQGRFDELEEVTDQAIQIGQRMSGRGPSEQFSPVTDDQGNIIGQRSSATGRVVSDPRTVKPEGLTNEQSNFEAMTKGFTPDQKMDARLEWAGIRPESGDAAQIDTGSAEKLVEGLPDSVQSKGLAAFLAAGGGKDGVKALQKAVEVSSAEVSRAEIPQMLDATFPNASPAERDQLEAAATSGKTVESGLKAAEGIRAEQRRLKKAKGFQERALQLLDNVLGSDQIGDVTGSIEGRFDFRAFSDAEAELITDIEELQNILTADNMDLMTGVLSESDIKILKNLSSGALNRVRGEGRFIKDVTGLRDKLSAKLVETVDDTDNKERLTFDPESGELVAR